MSQRLMIALDVDGTTINHAGELSPVVRVTGHVDDDDLVPVLRYFLWREQCGRPRRRR